MCLFLISTPSVPVSYLPLFLLLTPLLFLFLSSLLNYALWPTMSLDGPLLSLFVRVTQIVSDRPDTAACVRSPFLGQWVRKLPFSEGNNTQIKWLVNHFFHGTSSSGRLTDTQPTKRFSADDFKNHTVMAEHIWWGMKMTNPDQAGPHIVLSYEPKSIFRLWDFQITEFLLPNNWSTYVSTYSIMATMLLIMLSILVCRM